MRVVVEGKDGAPQPTGKGVAIKPRSLPALVDLLREAHAKAVAAGWYSDGP